MSRLLAVRLVLLLVLLVALGAAALTIDLPDVEVLRARVLAVGWPAPAVFVLGYALVVPLPLPKSVLNAVAGVTFGLAGGILLAVTAATLGSILSFGLGRALGRDVVHRFAEGGLDRVDDLVRRRGALAALLVRLVPVLPFTVLNYACGVTAMRLRHYVPATAVGILPGTSVLVAVTAAGAQISLWVPALISVGLATVSLTVAAVLHHRRRTDASPPPTAVGERPA